MNGNKNKIKKVYRLALYGLSGAGKTSVLAALAMPRYPHPLGHTCIWRTIDMSSLKEEVLMKDKQLMTLYRSQEWMEKAIQKLSEGELPEPNPIRDEHFIFEYDFTASTHQTFRIELVDYSGDLIHPEGSNNMLAKRLRQTFVEMDGIIVLAEAPFQTARIEKLLNNNNLCDGPTYSSLYPLRQAFSLLRCETPDCLTLEVPIALLITKWDRYSEIDYTHPENEQRKLEEFINSNPPPSHKGLCDVLHYSVKPGNFHLFPVSALGASECVSLDNGKIVERPKQINPLNAFGLEDAFIWTIKQRDAIDLQHYQEQASSSFKKSRITGLELLTRFPKDSEQAKQVQSLLQTSQKKKVFHSLYLVIALIVLAFGIETTSDVINYRQHQAVLTNNPDTSTYEQLQKTEKWLIDYTTAPDFRHVISKRFFNQKEAHDWLTQLQAQKEQLLWRTIEEALEANHLSEAKKQAQAYLLDYPAGQYAETALEILQRAEIRAEFEQKMQAGYFLEAAQLLLLQKNHPDAQFLKQLKLSFKVQVVKKITQKIEQSLDTNDNAVEAINLLKEYTKLPSELQSKAGQLDIQKTFNTFFIRKVAQQVKQAQNTQESLTGVINLVKEYARLPIKWQIEDSKREIKDIFNLFIIQEVEKQLKEINLAVTTQLLNEYASLPYELQSHEGRREIAQLQRHLDEMLYESIIASRNEESIKNYLENAPLKTMEKEVAEYQLYLDHQKSIQFKELKLKLTQIYWGQEVKEDKDNIVQVFWNKKLVVIGKNIESKHNHRTTFHAVNQTNEPFRSTSPFEEVEVRIKVVNEGLFFDTVYEGTHEDSLIHLVKGFSIELRDIDDDTNEKTGTIANFEIEGYPKEPYLPPWHGER
jgi:hypothetical protein